MNNKVRNKGYKFRLYPTKEQEEYLNRIFGSVRFIYNHVLDWRSTEYKEKNNKIGLYDGFKKITELRNIEEYIWLREIPVMALRYGLRNQENAFKNFFSKQSKCPKFKSKNSRQSFSLSDISFKLKNNKLIIPKCKTPLKIKWDKRKFPINPTFATISKDKSNRYFVSFVCEFKPEKLPINKNTIGIDMGLTHFAIFDKGEKIDNPKYFSKYQQKLKRAHQSLSRKKKGSNNRYKAKLKVAKIYAKISDCRNDHQHKLSRRIVNENQVICVEDLKVKNMVRNKKLSRHISDVTWSNFVNMLQYKSEWAGRNFVKIDQWCPSSKTCNSCGHVLEFLSLKERNWMCPSCNTNHDRDINAAINIRTAGLAGLAFGEDVRQTGCISNLHPH